MLTIVEYICLNASNASMNYNHCDDLVCVLLDNNFPCVFKKKKIVICNIIELVNINAPIDRCNNLLFNEFETIFVKE